MGLLQNTMWMQNIIFMALHLHNWKKRYMQIHWDIFSPKTFPNFRSDHFHDNTGCPRKRTNKTKS